MGKYDDIWKEFVENLFEKFTYFFLPDLAVDIDFSRKYDFLDKELAVISPESEESKRYADRLVKVYLKNGVEQWALIHLEVQGYDDKEFSERMFRYFYRIYDKFNQKIVSLVIFTDKNKDFRPDRFDYNYYQTELLFKYRTYKAIDSKEEDLLKENNPFALAVLAVKYSIDSKNDEEMKYTFKRKLMRLMLEKGYNDEEIINMLRFIDVMIELDDEDKEKILYEEFKNLQEGDKKMIITTFERIASGKTWDERFKEGIEEGIEKGKSTGKQEAILKLLRKKFKDVPAHLEEKIKTIENVEKLEEILLSILDVNSIEDIEKMMS